MAGPAWGRWLASDEAAYVTGAVIVVDGGMMARLSLFTERLDA